MFIHEWTFLVFRDIIMIWCPFFIKNLIIIPLIHEDLLVSLPLRYNGRFTAITVDPQVHTATKKAYDVLFIGTGKLLPVQRWMYGIVQVVLTGFCQSRKCILLKMPQENVKIVKSHGNTSQFTNIYFNSSQINWTRTASHLTDCLSPPIQLILTVTLWPS